MMLAKFIADTEKNALLDKKPDEIFAPLKDYTEYLQLITSQKDWSQALFLEKKDYLIKQLRHSGVNVRSFDSFLSAIDTAVKLLSNYYIEPCFTEKEGPDFIEWYEPNAQNPKYILRPRTGNWLWVSKTNYAYKNFQTLSLHIKHDNEPNEIVRPDNFPKILKAELGRHIANLLLAANGQINERAQELRTEQQKFVEEQKKLAERKQKEALPSYKIRKFLTALLLWPFRFFVSEKYVKEHSVFHFTFPKK